MTDQVNQCLDKNPWPLGGELQKSCLGGGFHSVLGDRERVVGTFREFIVYDSHQVFGDAASSLRLCVPRRSACARARLAVGSPATTDARPVKGSAESEGEEADEEEEEEKASDEEESELESPSSGGRVRPGGRRGGIGTRRKNQKRRYQTK